MWAVTSQEEKTESDLQMYQKHKQDIVGISCDGFSYLNSLMCVVRAGRIKKLIKKLLFWIFL
jgi:hypothetical protein